MKDLINGLITGMMCLVMTAGLFGCDKEAISSPAEHEDMAPLSDASMKTPRENYPVVAENTSPEQPVDPATQVSKLKGKITAISYDTGQVTIEDESGKRLVLKAGQDIDLKSFSEGDQIRSEYNSDMLITSLSRTDEN